MTHTKHYREIDSIRYRAMLDKLHTRLVELTKADIEDIKEALWSSRPYLTYDENFEDCWFATGESFHRVTLEIKRMKIVSIAD